MFFFVCASFQCCLPGWILWCRHLCKYWLICMLFVVLTIAGTIFFFCFCSPYLHCVCAALKLWLCLPPCCHVWKFNWKDDWVWNSLVSIASIAIWPHSLPGGLVEGPVGESELGLATCSHLRRLLCPEGQSISKSERSSNPPHCFIPMSAQLPQMTKWWVRKRGTPFSPCLLLAPSPTLSVGRHTASEEEL